MLPAGETRLAGFRFQGSVDEGNACQPEGLGPELASGLDRRDPSTPHCTRPQGAATSKPSTAGETWSAGWALRAGRLGLLVDVGGEISCDVQEVDCPLSVSARSHERPSVGTQQGEPVAEVRSVIVPGRLLESGLRALERRSELGNEFLRSVGVTTEPS